MSSRPASEMIKANICIQIKRWKLPPCRLHCITKSYPAVISATLLCCQVGSHMHDTQWTEIGNIVFQCYASAGDERCRYPNNVDAIPCKYNCIDTLLMPVQFGKPVINYSNELGLETSIYKWHSCIQRSPPWTVYLRTVSPKWLQRALPHQLCSMTLAKRANGKWTTGAPAALSAHVLFMSRGRRDAPRHTSCQKHTLPAAPEPLTTLPPSKPDRSLRNPRDIFTLCAAVLRSCTEKKAMIVIAGREDMKQSAKM